MAYFIEMIIIDKILRIVFTFANVNSVSLFVLCIIDVQSNFERSSAIGSIAVTYSSDPSPIIGNACQ